MVFERLFSDLANILENMFLKTPSQVQRKGEVLVDGFQNHRKYQNLGDNVNNPAEELEEQVSPVSPEDESPDSE